MRLIPLLLALATPLAAETRQHGNVLYDLPAGWTLGAREGAVQTILFHDESCGFCYLYLGPGAPAQGSVEAWLDAHAVLLLDPASRADATVLAPAAPLGEGGRPSAVAALVGGSGLLAAMAMQAGDRFQLLGFEGPAATDAESARSLAFYEAEVAPFLDTLRYVSEGAAPLLPPAVPGGLRGPWWGSAMVPTIGLDGRADVEVAARSLVFWPDGRFYDGTPPGGLAPLDEAALRDAADPDWGTYREEGDVLRLAYADGRRDELRRTAGGWSDARIELGPVKPLPDGATLDGRATTVFQSGFVPGSGLAGSYSHTTWVEFRPDGTYASAELGNAFGLGVDAEGAATGTFSDAAGGSERGRYAVADGVVVLHPDDGGPGRRLLALRRGGEVLVGGVPLGPR